VGALTQDKIPSGVAHVHADEGGDILRAHGIGVAVGECGVSVEALHLGLPVAIKGSQDPFGFCAG